MIPDSTAIIPVMPYDIIYSILCGTKKCFMLKQNPQLLCRVRTLNLWYSECHTNRSATLWLNKMMKLVAYITIKLKMHV